MNIDVIKILIIEDDVLIAESLKFSIEDFGYEVIAICNTYNQAILSLENVEFDVLLTDINLGEGIDKNSGINVAEYCNNNFNKPIIYLSAYVDKDTITKSVATKPAGYLVKPINEYTLFATIQLAIENYNTNNSAAELHTVDYLFLKTGKSTTKVYWKDVYYIETLKNYVKLHTYSRQSGLLIRSTLINFSKTIMPPIFLDKFIKISRAELLLKSIITKFDKEKIITTQGEFENNTGSKIVL